MNGLLNVFKPSGPTSHDVVVQARRILRTRRIGHAGTLDPLASGVLLLCVGRATRLVEYLVGLPKRYDATAEFGVATNTQDLTGEVIATRDAVGLRPADVENALDQFRGEIQQTPPMVSAVKHDGQRLYQIARQGIEVERTARPVTIYELDMLEFYGGERPRARLSVLCSSGTYIRTLIHDLGNVLGTGASMAALGRTAIGRHTIDSAITLEELAELAHEGRVAERLVVPAEMVSHLASVEVSDAEIPKLLNGGMVIGQKQTAQLKDGEPLRLMAGNGEILAIGRLELRCGECCYLPTKVLKRLDGAN